MQTEKQPFPRWMIAALAVMLLFLLAGGWWLYRSQEQTMRQRIEAELTAIAQLKAGQVADWFKERLSDAAILQNDPYVTMAVARLLADPYHGNAEALRARLLEVQKHGNYADILLVDPDGRLCLSLKDPVEIHEGYMPALAAAIRNHGPAIAHLHSELQNPAPHISVVAPFFTGNAPAPRPLGAAILVSNAVQFLYPLIQSWPVPSKTAETLLVRRDGDDVLFLNELRHQKDTAVKLRIPLSRSDLTEAMAIQGHQGVVEGRDYRGVPVVAVILPIPDMPCFMVAKMDRTEIYADWHFHAVLILTLLAGLAVIMVSLTLFVWQREKKKRYQELYLSEAALRASMERHGVTLKSIGDAVIVTDAQGRVDLLNPAAEALTGWNQEEACGKLLTEVFRIVEEGTRREVESPAIRVLREGLVAGLANHTLLIAKNGVERPITDSGAPIHNEKGEITGVVLVFRDQSSQRKAQRLTQVRLDLLDYAAGHTLDELLTKALDEISACVDSPIGFCHFIGSDQKTLFLQQWSTRTLKEFCRAEGKGLHYSIDQAGVWVDSMREKKPVIHNDYESLPHKKGLPENHVLVVRELVVPVMRGDRVEALLGVGNKPVDYTEKDAETVAYLADVTWEIVMRKRTEQSLVDSERKWRSILVNTPQIGVSLNPQARIVFANEHLLHLTGWKEEEILDRDWFELFIPEAIRGEVRKVFIEVMNAKDTLGFSTYENEIVTRTGELRHIVWSNVLTRDAQGQILDVTCLGIDITERKLAEVERARLLSAIEQSGEAMVITNPDGVITYVNPMFESMTGYSRTEALGQTPRILKSGKQDEAFYRELWATISGGHTWRGHIVNRRKNGSLYTEVDTISPVYDAAGRLINYVAVKRDITAHLQLEAQLHQAQKMESVGQLAGGVAHDFNNMLGVIVGYTELTLTRVAPDDPLHANLEEILKAARRSTEITRQLLAFARKQTIAPEVLDLNATLEGMLKMLRRLIGEDINLAWQPSTGLWPVMMDPSQVDQILANLCVNARDAIAGTGTITIETANAVFDKAYCNDHPGFVPGEFILLTVSDDGCGMEKEIQDKIFEPFFTTKQAGRGTGLGLATVYGIVKQNNGFINVYSEPGLGTTFKIYLPRHKSKALALQTEPAPEIASGHGELVLLVEDEPA
ncbi:MAG: PAS domain S-box protein, partial [Thermodesulfobacteriota bacterium]